MTRPTSTAGATNKLSGRGIALGLLGLAAIALTERLLVKASRPEQPTAPDLTDADYDSVPRPMRTEDIMTDAISQAMAGEVAETRATYGDAYADQVAESNRRIAAQMLNQSQAGSQSLTQITGNLRG